MIPLRDNIPSFRRPYVNFVIIGVTALFFLWELSLGQLLPRAIEILGFVPGRFLQFLWSGQVSLSVTFFPLLTSIFLHGGWLHLLGNLWFLYIFGDNVEDVLGHWRYLALYLLSGVGANLIYLLFSPYSRIPLVGASGAIAGVMGAYFVLFPGARVFTLVPIFILVTFMEIPAYIFLGFWFVMQFLFGAFSTVGPQQAGGVAWWAHVGGFLVGILLLLIMEPGLVKRRFRGW
ncbi:MAG: rhomboid family intramembrane serine protease [Deltaproteobacteria bacterium]|nr:rhomboid family intramembrane serine protease [Deltaproteobacteria bacterium]